MCFALTMTDVLIQKATTEMNQRTLNVKRWLNDQQNLFIVRHPRWLKIIVMCKQFNSLALSDLALVWKKTVLIPMSSLCARLVMNRSDASKIISQQMRWYLYRPGVYAPSIYTFNPLLHAATVWQQVISLRFLFSASLNTIFTNFSHSK